MITPEIIVLLGRLLRRIEEASAQGFHYNATALVLVNEFVDLAQRLEDVATKECLGGEQ